MKNTEHKKTKFIKVYFTPSEYDEVKQKATAKGQTMATYVRSHYISK